MPQFSKASIDRLNSCDVRLQNVCFEVIKTYDFSVLCGHRNEKAQNEAFENGTSKLRWPKSKHNSSPSKAVDLAPYPIDWGDTKRFAELASLIIYEGQKQGVEIFWGGNFKGFLDMPHFELRD